MGSIRKTKTKRRTRDLDQIHADLHSTKHLTQFKNAKPAEDLPGLGQWYCVECAKFFEGEHNLREHRRGKNHKRRVRLLKETPYSQKEAEAAIGLQYTGPLNLIVYDVQWQNHLESAETTSTKVHNTKHNMVYKKRELFGGAMTVEAPEDFYDVSDLRQVPDTQEVFQERDGDHHIIFDLLEYVEHIEELAEAARYHLEDYASGDGDLTVWNLELIRLTLFPTDTPAASLFATLPADKDGKTTAILLILIRLKGHKTDILVTMNLKDVSMNGVQDYEDFFRGSEVPDFKKGKDVIEHVNETLKICDYGLFHPEAETGGPDATKEGKEA